MLQDVEYPIREHFFKSDRLCRRVLSEGSKENKKIKGDFFGKVP
jgi:hypothetical protein